MVPFALPELARGARRTTRCGGVRVFLVAKVALARVSSLRLLLELRVLALSILSYLRVHARGGGTVLGVCPTSGLAIPLAAGSSKRRSRSSHHHHGRHKGRRNQQTNALNHAISFPSHIHPMPMKPKLHWIECVFVGAGRVVCVSTKLQTSVRPLSSCPCVLRSR